MSIENILVARIHEEFKKLPTRCKPRRYGANDEFTEWTVVAGLAVVGSNGSIEHVSLASGMKCIPRNVVANAKGCVLHDSHAEILAIRAFNRFLLDEADKMLNGRSCNGNDVSKAVEYQSKIIQWQCGSSRSSSDHLDHWQPPFGIKDDLKIFMYCSEMPCGDASIELVMSRQKDQTPWPIDESVAVDEGLKGMSRFSQLGIVRRKPGRADSRYTGSKSCADKLALKQCTSLLSSLTSAFITPYNAYIDTLILPEVQYHENACIRCFNPQGRMKALNDNRWANGYHFYPFHISTTNVPFAYARPWYDRGADDGSVVNETVRDRARSSNFSAIEYSSLVEVTIKGVLQGRKQDDPRGATTISRVSMMALALRIRDSLHRIAVGVPDQRTIAPPPSQGSVQCGPDQVTIAPPPSHGSVKPQSRSPRTLAAGTHLIDLSKAPAAPGFVEDEAHHGDGGAMNKLFQGAKTYYEAKRDLALIARRKVKMDVTTTALQNWVTNEVDDFPIELSRQ